MSEWNVRHSPPWPRLPPIWIFQFASPVETSSNIVTLSLEMSVPAGWSLVPVKRREGKRRRRERERQRERWREGGREGGRE